MGDPCNTLGETESLAGLINPASPGGKSAYVFGLKSFLVLRPIAHGVLALAVPLDEVGVLIGVSSSRAQDRSILQSPCFQRLYSENTSRGSLSNEILDKISKTSFLPTHFGGHQSQHQ